MDLLQFPRMAGAEHHYVGEAGRKYHELKRAVPAEAYDWVARSRAEKLQPRVRETDVVLEFGVGHGWNLAALKCARKIGIDLSEFLREELEARGIEYHGGTRTLPDALADVIICHHSLEHVLDPAGVLQEMRRLLRDPGRLLVFVPFEKERRYRRYHPGEPNHHLYSWNAQTLPNLVSECGFSVEHVVLGRFGYDRFASKIAVRWKLRERGFRAVRWLALLARPQWEVRLVASKAR